MALEMATAAVLLMVALVSWPVWKMLWHVRDGAPGSTGWPLVGETLQLLACFRRGAVEEFGAQRRKRYGSGVFKTHLFGTPYVFVSGPEAAKMLATSEDKLVNAQQFLPPSQLLGKESLLNMHGPKHKRFRSLFNDTFHGEGLRKYLPTVEAIALESFADWRVGDVRSMKNEATEFTYNVIAGVVLSWGPGLDRERSMKLSRTVGSNMFQAPINLPGFPYRKAKLARKEMLEMLDRELALRRSKDAGEIERDDLLNSMMAMRDWNGEPALNDEELKDNIFTLILAGHETSTNQLTWTAKLLHENPTVKDKLLAEHQAIRSKKTEGEPLTWSDLQQMTFTVKVINEGLRISSLIFWYHRTVKQDFQYQGCRIKKGWNIVLDLHHLHHDSGIFSEPDKFQPSRLDEPPKPYTLLPFGTGPRMCLGKDLTMMEMKVFLHHFMLNYRWSVTEPDKGRDFSGLPCPENGVPVRIEASIGCSS